MGSSWEANSADALMNMQPEKSSPSNHSARASKTANSRARANDLTDGFVKILADAETDAVLGAHIIGADAGSLIHEIVTVIEFDGAAEDIARICHGHPTFNEAVKEAALAVDGRPIHL